MRTWFAICLFVLLGCRPTLSGFFPCPPLVSPTRKTKSPHPASLIAEDDNVVNGGEQQLFPVEEERHLRFAGVGRLYATASNKINSTAATTPHLEIVDRLSTSQVVVVGLGGVGSWSAEALCRSGVGNLVLIDLDDICISNTNRQLHALSSTVGQMKLDEMKRRLSDINPQCNVTLIHDFLTVGNVDDILDACFQEEGRPSVVLDAMDGTKEKSALLAACTQRRIPIVTVGAAAGRSDPTRVVCEDLTRVEGDRMLASCRRSLRKFYGFQQGLSFRDKQMNNQKGKKRSERKWNIPAVFSTEILDPKCQQSTNNVGTSSFRLCDGPLGTACFVTGSFGFIAAGRVVEMIARDQIVPPRLQGHHMGVTD